MTGETEPKRKRVLEEDIVGGVALADRRCVAYMGTNVINGMSISFYA
jgi:magnesium-transporting ATPase (P-type)